jgi:DNA-binding transcriptional LysR family regulator
MTRPMNIEHLKTFQEIVRLGSFSEVARKLHVSQPAVSFQIQRLEQELGVRLIDRSQRSITPTEAGKALLRFAEAVGGEREKLRRDLEKMKEEVSGDLKIAASTIPGEYLLPPLLAKFKNLHPAVTIQVDVSDSLTVIGHIQDKTYEIGFCGAAPENRDLEYFKIDGDEIVLIVYPEHPFAGRQEIAPPELESEPFIFREANSGTRHSLEKLLERAGVAVSKLKAHLVLSSPQAVISAVASGAGIAFVSSLAAAKSAASFVKTVKVSGLNLNRDFYCVYRRELRASRPAEEFKNFIQIETSKNA